tara:strand:+ start:87 stop:572 length:486 start_codon:yes stop_codon:yes gene_type:complete
MTYEIDAKRGVANHYGVRTTDGSKGAQSKSTGIVKRAQWDWTWDNLPDAGANNLQWSIPANATIVSAVLYVDTAFTSTSTTTDLTIGLQEADGTEIDNDGLVEADEATETTIAVANSVITGAGALIGKTVGAAAGELVVTPSADDLLTGAGRVVVEYVLDK